MFADLVRLRPGDGRHWACYGRLLKDRGDRAGAGAALEKAVAELGEAIRSSARRRRGPHQPRQRPGRPGEAGRGHRRIPRRRSGIRPDTPWPTTTSASPWRPGEGGRGHRRIPRGDPAPARRRRGPLQPRHRPAQGKPDEAIAEFRAAIRLRPDYAEAHSNLGAALTPRGRWTRPSPNTATAIRLRPDDAMAHSNLGTALAPRGRRTRPSPNTARRSGSGPTRQGPQQPRQRPAAPRGSRTRPSPNSARRSGSGPTTPRPTPTSASPWSPRGSRTRPSPHSRGDPHPARPRRGPQQPRQRPARPGEAGRGHRRIPRGDPHPARLRHGPLQPRQRPERPGEGGRGHRRIPRRRSASGPTTPRPTATSATSCSSKAAPARPSPSYRKGHELGSKRPDWRYPSAELVRQAERLVALEARLPAVLRGEDQPRDAAEWTRIRRNRRYQLKRYGAVGAALCRRLRADPGLAEDMDSANRYNAACAAALAGCRTGREIRPTDEAEKARWRQAGRRVAEGRPGALGQAAEGGKAEAEGPRRPDAPALEGGRRPGRPPRRGRRQGAAGGRAKGLPAPSGPKSMPCSPGASSRDPLTTGANRRPADDRRQSLPKMRVRAARE